MGMKGSWFSAVKKVLSTEQKDKKDQKAIKSKKKWIWKQKSSVDLSLFEGTSTVSFCAPAPPSPPPIEDVKLTAAKNEQNKHAYSVVFGTVVAAEVAVAAVQAAAEVVRLTAVARYPGKSNEEIAAIKIQTAFRGYLARRALRALRGLVRLKSLIQGQSVKRLATTALKCMQTLARVQSQIQVRRIRISEENLALQRQLHQKCEKEVEKLRALQTGGQWDHSAQSKEQIEAKIQQKQEAAMRRERQLAYAFSHQQTRKNSKSANPTFLDPNNPHWGWSWLERWMAARPWESGSALYNNDLGSIKSATSHAMSIGEISRVYSHRDLRHNNKDSPTAYKLSQPPSRCQSPSTPLSKTPSTSSATGKIRPPSPKGSQLGGDDDSRSVYSVQSDRYRRHSTAGSSMGYNGSLASSPSVRSDVAPTKSPLKLNGTPEKRSVGSAKKRLSFPSSPAGPRRH